MELTFRQVKGFLQVIERAELVEYYNSILSYRTGAVWATLKEFPSLDEFFALTLGETPKEPKGFDEKTDSLLEAEAFKRLAERQKNHVK